MKEFNKNQNRRDTLIWGNKTPDYFGGIASFEISSTLIKTLIKEEFADLNDVQNDSPTMREFLEFCDKYSNYNINLHGYAVSSERNDYRITIEGISYHGLVTKEMMVDFTILCQDADDFICNKNELYCWYD